MLIAIGGKTIRSRSNIQEVEHVSRFVMMMPRMAAGDAT